MGALANTRPALRAWVLAVLALEALVPAAHFASTRHAPDAHGATTHLSRCDHAAPRADHAPRASTALEAADARGAQAAVRPGACAEPHAEICALAAALQSGLAARPSSLAGPSSTPPLVRAPPRAPPRAVDLAPYRLAPKTSPPVA